MSVGIETAFSEKSHLFLVRPLVKQAARCFDVPIFQVEEALSEAPHADALAAFCKAGGPQKLLIYTQPPPEDSEDDEPLIYVSSGESDKFVERGILIAKASAELELNAANVETDVSCNVVLGSPMKALLSTIDQVYLPVLTASSPHWGASLPEEVAPEFFVGVSKFVAMLTDAVHGVEGGVELVKPTVRADNVDPKQKGFERAASNPELVASYEAAVLSWCDAVEELLDDVPPPARVVPEGEAGPSSELEHWKVRTSKFNSINEQLRSKEHRVVVGVLQVARAPALRRWKTLDGPITDAANEAKDNVKYLATLEKCVEPLYSGSPSQIADCLPALMNHVKMTLTIARYYNTTERMSTLMCKVTNAMVSRLSAYLEEPGKLWAQEPAALLEHLEEAITLDETYRDEYKKCKDALKATPSGKQLDLDERLIFGKMAAFCGRLETLMQLFATIEQFSELATHNVEGMGGLLANFGQLVDEFKGKPYSLLDFRKSQFEEDFEEFNASVYELEAALQAFINQSFESIHSTLHALALLRQFQAILQRDSLKEDLESKLTVIFHNYGLDLETVQLLYEKQKDSPPIVRNAPPVAGNIIWARQLMRRIETPMVHFQEHEELMQTRESRKIVKAYNRIAKTIVSFETLWKMAWEKSIDASKAGLQATLIIRHPKTNKLFVNFDREILLLIRETKCLMRIGIEVPEAARLVVMQEDKFKAFYNQLSYALVQHEALLAKVLPITAPLLRPHLQDMQRKLQPGMVTLTWTSMNIDAFLHSMYSGVAALDDLMSKIRDIVDNRIERNLKTVAQSELVELPVEESFTLDRYVAVQEKLIKSQQSVLASKNREVEEAVSDLLEEIAAFKINGGPAGASEAEAAHLRQHYSKLFYRAVLNATKAALKRVRKRVGSRASGGFLFVDRPIFDVNVELSIPHVTMGPSLEEIQSAINRSCRAILGVARTLTLWSTAEERASGQTLFEQLASDKEIVVMVLLLTGSMEGAKRQVYDYLQTFGRYDWLWQGNMQAEYAAFMEKSPSLFDFECELKKYVEVEREIAHISPVHNIGALSLETAPLKSSLRSEAAAWKAQYGQNLHAKAHAELERVLKWMADMQRNLGRPVNDLDAVREAISRLKELREKESSIDAFLEPVEEMYALLSRYDLPVKKEELDQVGDLRYTWKKLLSVSNDVSTNLAELQVGFKSELLKNVKAFIGDVAQFRIEFEVSGPMVPGIPPKEATERLRRFQQMYEQRERKYTTYSAGEDLFGLPQTDYPELGRTKKELDLLEKLYSLYTNVTASVETWRESPWEAVTMELPEMFLRIGEFQALCTRMPKDLRQWDAYVELKHLIDDFSLSLPLVQQLAHPAMRPRHWGQVIEATGEPLAVGTPDFKLLHVLNANLLDHGEVVEDICNSSIKELQIEEKLTSISDDWSDEQLSFGEFKARGKIVLRGGETAELIEKVEETLMALGSMLASRYVAPFREGVQSWVSKLSAVSDVLEVWIQVQAMWVYLEAVFTSGDIAKQLPQESKRFQGIDKSWEKVMVKALETRNVVSYIYGNDMLQELLPHLLEQLEVCQKALSGYLDQKRAAFPRFYFVSDANLLEILSQGSNPQAIQPHLQSVFAAVVRTDFDPANKLRIINLYDMAGECVDLEKPVEMVGNIEDWLYKLLKAMQTAVNGVVRAASTDCSLMRLDEFTHGYLSQVALLGIQIKWTLDCEDALYRARQEKAVMNATAKKNLQRLNELVRLNLQTDAELGQHGAWTRTKVETMILVDVHQRDVFDEMIKLKIREPDHFEWQKQARFYFDTDKDVAQVAVADVDFDYCNEYLGVKERLVITPLTDRCYITLSQALGMCLGGAPAGPAGTGKTETVKDMGNTLGKYVVVFNCGDQMDYRIMGGILKGLAQSGCWGCFDEFNRIDLEVLSVVAQQVSSVLDGLKASKLSFQFTDGQVINLDKEVGFFITMNPGYAGRQELPENLKSLFRGVTMMVPDREIIMKVKLTACGYEQNALLAKKFNVLYRLCEQQLSKQAHYDFGLRNILAVLRTSGTSKRENVAADEMLLLMRTLRDMNLSKYVAEDVPLFLSLIGDLFPGVQAEKATHPIVEKQIDATLAAIGLQKYPPWFEKIIQVYEMSLVRHSLMAVGPSGVGKSKIVEVLHGALAACTATDSTPPLIGQPHREVRMNPKAITAPQMFGALDVVANEWTEGIFAQLWRKANKDKKNFTWLVLDGPVDAIWIENMNTVMDDNRILTLANNDRIPMLRPNVTLHFEVEDLRNASPATVSRAGIIYVSAKDLGWRPMADSYVASRKPEEGKELAGYFDKYIEALLAFIGRECTARMDASPMGLVASLTTLFTALTAAAAEVTGAVISAVHLERIFLYSLIWSVGGLLEAADRARVDAQLRTMTSLLPALAGDADENTVYEYKVNEVSGEWEHWSAKVLTWKPTGDLSASFPSILVPTIDSTRCEYTLELSLSQRRPVLLMGGPGTAKTSTVLQVLAKQNPAETLTKTLSFSSATTPAIFQATIEGGVEKRQGKTFGPPGNKRMVVFIDDISMPEVNTWGDQITLEIVRQLIEYGGVYNLQKPGEWKSIVDIDVLGCMLTPGGGKNDIPNRAKRHFHVMNVTLPSKASIQQIFGSLVAALFNASCEGAVAAAARAKLVRMTTDVWQRVKAKMLPTPAKFHYIFNLRDLSRVFQGIFMCPVADVLQTEHDLLALWSHECLRVFSDRMISHEDKEWCAAAIVEAARDTFADNPSAEEGAIEVVSSPCWFVDFMRPAGEDPETGEELPAPRVYEPVYELAPIVDVVGGYMAKFNAADKLHATQLVLFQDAVEHFCRISRILITPRGSALLVGVGGSGRQSLTRLAAYIGKCNTSQITITKTYGVSNLLEDWKPLFLLAGVKGVPQAFIFTDKEIKDEGFLEYINIFLCTGELPNLFARDEIDAIVGEIGPTFEAAMPKGTEPTPAKLYAFFIERVRANLHLVLCFSPIGDRFRTRARMFPGLVNATTVDWFLAWPEEALAAVAQHFMGKFEICDEDAEAVRTALIGHMARVHRLVSESTDEYFERYRRRTYVTPRSYLGFIELYRDVYVSKAELIDELASSINVGLEKLAQATQDVDLMKVELGEKEKVLAVAKEKSSALLQEITASTTVAEKKKAEVQAVKDKLGGEAEVIAGQKAEIEAELAAAQPALDEADNALKAITAKDLGVLRGLKSPPNLIQRLFDCVLILLRIDLVRDEKLGCVAVTVKDRLQLRDSWKNALPAMSQSSFLASILAFDRDKVNDEDVELLYPYTIAEDFTYNDAKKVSSNVAGLCTWIRAMCTYTEIAKVVKPKMAELATALGHLKVANAKLAMAQGELDQCQAQLDKMQMDFDDAMAAKARIQADADATQRRMDAANKLIGGLSGEQTRWTAQSEAFTDETRRLAGDVALACAFMAYAGPFNADFRTILLRQKFTADCVERSIPLTAGLDVSSFMVDEATVGEWAMEGLPSDELSVQNGIMVTRSSRWPLLIDPQGQGLSWIKRREERNHLRVSNMGEKRFRNQLEDAMSFGQPLLLENVEEEIDPVLDPVLDKAIQRSGRGWKIVLADKECEYTETFTLVLCSNLANPHFSPELCAQVTVVNMTVTMGGLEQQLLGRVVQRERAELEEQRQKLMAEVTMNQKMLKGLEDDLLYRLANSTGNLLDDTELIEVLQMTKQTGTEVQEKLETAKQTDLRISAAREEYRLVATRGSLLYFLVVDMASVNPMYQVSLQQFLGIFDESIEQAAPAPIANKRILNIVEYVTFHATCYMQRGLFERHKTIWALMLTMKIQQVAGELSAAAVQALLTGGGALDVKSEPPKPADWLPDAVWLNCLALSRAVPRAFRELPESLAHASNHWKAWYDDDAPEQQKLPLVPPEGGFSDFDKLLLVRCVRDDRMLLAAQDYIANAIGQRYIESRALDFRAVEEEAHCRCPVVCILSQGSDPTALVMDLARKVKKQVRSISLGQGQEPAARKLLHTGVTQGSWVMLQNCHLGLKFMGELEQMMVKLEEIHPEFQIFLTTEPHVKFPIGLLQMSIKITNEAPAGVKAGLKASYQWVTQDVLDSVSHPQWKTMLYALCFMHTIVQERRKFGPLGFNIPYEFNQSDLSACVMYLQNHLSMVEAKKRPVDWDCVNYMICAVQYGGRITDDWDRRLFNTYGQAWLNPAILDSTFRFYDVYRIPYGMDVDAYRKYVDKLPLIDATLLFGLHPNADIAFRTRQTGMVLGTVLDVQPKAGGGSGGETREEAVLRQVRTLQAKLPGDYRPDSVASAIHKQGGPKPLNICLQQEVDRLQKVLTVVRASLANLALAIAGTIVMSPELTNALDALYMARVPDAWAKASQLLAPNTGVWFSQIVLRAEQLSSWLGHGRPAAFWLTGFFNPQGFLTANRQEVCRKHAKENWALDDVVNSTEVLRQEREEVRKGPEEGVYLHGLFLEGCRWDKQGNKLSDSDPKVLHATLPVLHVTGALAATGMAGGGGAPAYSCPCYKNPKRTDLNFIFAVDLRSEEAPSKWTLRGVCLLTSKE